MRAWLPVCLVFLLLSILPVSALAQALPPAGSVPDFSRWTPGPATDARFAGNDHQTAGETSEATTNPWALDILAGLPLGVRLQRTIGPGPDGPFILEGIAGLWVILPMAGVGARVQFTPFSGTHNSLVVSPGFDAYLMENWISGLLGGQSTVFLLGGNLDIAWRHVFSSGADGRFGLELGVLDNLTKGEHRMVPEATFFVGWRF